MNPRNRIETIVVPAITVPYWWYWMLERYLYRRRLPCCFAENEL